MNTNNNTSYPFPLKEIKVFLLVFLFFILNPFASFSQSLPESNDTHIYFSNGEKNVNPVADRNEYYEIYSSLGIYLDTKGNTSFEEIFENRHLFQVNNTVENFDHDATYWVKIEVQARKTHQDSLLFSFKNLTIHYGWEKVDAFLLHEDGKIDHQQTGLSLQQHEKSIDHTLDLILFGLVPNEKATLFF